VTENQQNKLDKHMKKNIPFFHSKMTEAERLKKTFESVARIQSFWRWVVQAKRFNVLRLSDKQQKLKLVSRFKRFENYSCHIVIVYLRHEQKFIMTFTVSGLERRPVVYQTFIFIQPIMQFIYGYDWDKINRTEPSFIKKTLPQIAMRVMESLDLFSQTDEEGKVKVCCKLHLEIPQQLSLERKEDPYNLRKDEVVETKEDFPLAQKLKFIVKLQRAYKSVKARRNLREAIIKERRRQLIQRNLGTLLKTTYKKISGEFYRISVYSNITSNEEFLRFQIMPAPGGLLPRETKAFVSYRVNENKFMNCHGLQLIDYLLSLIRKEQDSLKFYFLDVGQRFESVVIKDEFAEDPDEADEGNELHKAIEADHQLTFDKVVVNNTDQIISPERHCDR
jgi:hypothetical protein